MDYRITRDPFYFCSAAKVAVVRSARAFYEDKDGLPFPIMASMVNESRYQSLDDVVRGIGKFEREFFAKKDRRAVFATTYLAFTRVLAAWLQEGRFEDPEWMSRYGIAFADLYRQAVIAYQRGETKNVPKAWRISFETSATGRGLIIHDLLLGMNAHINRDLPFALQDVSIDPGRESRFRDHSLVNEALRAATDPVQNHIARTYAPGLALIDRTLGPLDERVSSFSFTKARWAAWEAAVSLVNSRTDAERGMVGAGIESRATVLARLVLAPTLDHPWLVGLLGHLESRSPWWEVLEPG